MLHGDCKYCDWIVTTAFYAALHFVEHKLFHPPITPFPSLGDAKISYGAISYHKAREYVIADHFPEIKAAYAFLSKESHTSRYIDYHTTKPTADKARSSLAHIKKKCK